MMTHRYNQKLFLVVFTLILSVTLTPSTTFAWGATAHRAIGEIADRSLTPKAREQVKEILKGQSLASASTWADEIRSDPLYQFTIPWHFVEIPIGTEYDPAKASSKGDLLQEIQIMADILKGKKQPLKIETITLGKPEALKFLIHFVGDLHQPFHIGNGRDRGAHLCRVKWFGDLEHIGKLWSLHSVWDDGITDSLHLSFTELARFILEKKLSPAETKKIKSGKPLDWANESKKIQEGLYPGIKAYTAETTEPVYCTKYRDNKKPDANDPAIPALEYDYRYQVLDIAKQRIREAGLRLAMILNNAL